MKMPPLQRLIEWGLLTLIALIPFHALLVVSLGHFIGRQSLWAAWKEVLILILAALTLKLLIEDQSARSRLRQPIVYTVIAFAVVGLVVTLIAHPSVTTIAFGIKTDLEFLLVSLIAIVVGNQNLLRRLTQTLLAATAIVVGFALLQATLLPPDLLTHVGYGYTPGQPAPYETVLVGSTVHNRFGSTLGGPNQLGTFLILPLIITLLFGLKERRWWLASVAILPAIFISYSRGAWIGAAVAVVFVGVVVTRGRLRQIIAGLAILVALAVLVLAVSSGNIVSNYLHHPSKITGSQNSDTQHLASLTDGAKQLIDTPFGHGLGTAGPATFHSGTINIIEDDYLQVGYETGIIGLLLFVTIVALTVNKLARQTSLTSVAAGGAIIGISITALVLPAWTDTSTALTVWTLAGAGLGARHV